MFLGHFAAGVAARPLLPRVHLGALLLATQLLDVVVLLLMPWGVEGIAPGSRPLEYGGIIAKVPVSHSLPVALVLSLVVGLAAYRHWQSQKAGIILGLLVFSHWLLDLPVHHQDMPWLPHNWGNYDLIGFGWYQYPVPTLLLEAGLMLAAVIWAYMGFYRKNVGEFQIRQWYFIILFSIVTLIVHIGQLPDHNGIEQIALEIDSIIG